MTLDPALLNADAVAKPLGIGWVALATASHTRPARIAAAGFSRLALPGLPWQTWLARLAVPGLSCQDRLARLVLPGLPCQACLALPGLPCQACLDKLILPGLACQTCLPRLAVSGLSLPGLSLPGLPSGVGLVAAAAPAVRNPLCQDPAH